MNWIFSLTLILSCFLNRAYSQPISNEIWQQIAGDKTNEQYEIVKGDTLYDISKRLFGDPKYWPKIWAINNKSILNPHLIYPGRKISFSPGTGISLPTVNILGSGNQEQVAIINGTKAIIPNTTEDYAPLAKEWKNLGPQAWETIIKPMPQLVDPDGFDRKSAVVRAQSRGFELTSFIKTEEMHYLGEITGSTSGYNGLTLSDTVFIKAYQELQIGETYTLTSEPVKVKAKRYGKSGYSYLNVGNVKIISVRDGVFVGIITSGLNTFTRGTYIIPLVENLKEPELIAAPTPIEGRIVIDPRLSTSNFSQFKTVYIDRGSDQGVKPGMIFRSYQHYDPSTQKPITYSDFIIHANFLVLDTSESFSTIYMLNGADVASEDTPAVLLTDITDMLKPTKEEYGSALEGVDKDLDELDKLDRNGELGKEERQELKQLERWKDTDSTDNPESLPLPPSPQTETEAEKPMVDDPDLDLDETLPPPPAAGPESKETVPSVNPDTLPEDPLAPQEDTESPKTAPPSEPQTELPTTEQPEPETLGPQ